MQLKTVDKVTPTGRIKLVNGLTYTNSGRSMGEHYHHSYICSVEEYKKEEEKKNLEREKIQIANQICINTRLSKDQLQRIYNITKE